MQRFIPGWRLAGRIEPDSEPSTISSTSKAIKTRHRTRTTRSTTSIGTTEALSFHSATPGLDAFTPLQLVTESSTSTTFSELSTSPSSTRAQPPETYFGTRIYSYPSSPLASPVTDPQSLVAFSPPVISVALVCSGTALIALVICVSLYRCSCAATRERENDHHNVKESPLFGGRDMNSEKYTVMGSLDSWESLQASLAHGMGRMPQAATSQSPQNTCPSSDPLTGMNECSWGVATGGKHPSYCECQFLVVEVTESWPSGQFCWFSGCWNGQHSRFYSTRSTRPLGGASQAHARNIRGVDLRSDFKCHGDCRCATSLSYSCNSFACWSAVSSISRCFEQALWTFPFSGSHVEASQCSRNQRKHFATGSAVHHKFRCTAHYIVFKCHPETSAFDPQAKRFTIIVNTQ